MATDRPRSGNWRRVKAVLRFPIRVIAGVMSGTGRALNATHYPGAGGGVGDWPVERSRPPRRNRRRSRRARTR